MTATITPGVYNVLLAYGTTMGHEVPIEYYELPDGQSEDNRLVDDAQSYFQSANYTLSPSNGVNHLLELDIIQHLQVVTACVFSTHGTITHFSDSESNSSSSTAPGSITLAEVGQATQLGNLPQRHLVFIYSCEIGANNSAPSEFATKDVGGAFVGFEEEVSFYLIPGETEDLYIPTIPEGAEFGSLADHWAVVLKHLVVFGDNLAEALRQANLTNKPRKQPTGIVWGALDMVIGADEQDHREDPLSTLKWVYLDEIQRENAPSKTIWYIKI